MTFIDLIRAYECKSVTEKKRKGRCLSAFNRYLCSPLGERVNLHIKEILTSQVKDLFIPNTNLFKSAITAELLTVNNIGVTTYDFLLSICQDFIKIQNPETKSE